MKRVILAALLSMLFLSSWSQVLPEGATLLYHSETRGTNNGVYLTHYTIYEQSGKYYMRRIRGFAGAMTPIRTKKDKIHYLPEVTFELTKSQVKKIGAWLKESDIKALSHSCEEEMAANPTTESQPRMPVVWGNWGPTDYKQVIEWPHAVTGVKLAFTIDFNEYSKEEFKQRATYLKAIYDFNEKLEEIGYKYVKRHISKLWQD